MAKNQPVQEEEGELEELLQTSQAKNQEESIIIPVEIPITTKALEKAQAYGPLVKEIGRQAYEWYGFIAGKKDDEQNIVRDLILAKDQDVSSAFVKVEGAKVALATREVEQINKNKQKNYQILGWIHNHADFGTFHSGTDDNNIYTVLNSVSLNTEKPTKKALNLIESTAEKKILEDKIVINGKDQEDAVIEYLLQDNEAAISLLKKYGIKPDGKDPKKLALALLNDLIGLSKFEVKETKMIGYCYSIVVNNNASEPYGEIAVLEEDVISGKKKQYKSKVPVKVIEVPDDITFTEEELRKEIKAKIDFPNWLQRTFRGGRKQNWQYGYDYGYDYTYGTPVGHPVYTTPTTIGHGRRVHYSTAVGTEAEEEKTKGKKPSLKKITHVFTRKAIEYLNDYEYTSNKFAGFLDKVLCNIFTKESGLEKAIKEAGQLVPDEYATLPKLKKLISNRITNNIYKDLKKTNDEKAIRFMTDFIIAGAAHEQNQTLLKYISILNGINPLVIDFADEIVEYADDYQVHSNYRSWSGKVLNQLLKNKDFTLEQAIISAGQLGANDKLIGTGGTVIYDGDKLFIKSKIYVGEYDQSTLEFMKGFINPKTREKALMSYVNKVISAHTEKEEQELEELLKESETKPMKKPVTKPAEKQPQKKYMKKPEIQQKPETGKEQSQASAQQAESSLDEVFKVGDPVIISSLEPRDVKYNFRKGKVSKVLAPTTSDDAIHYEIKFEEDKKHVLPQKIATFPYYYVKKFIDYESPGKAANKPSDGFELGDIVIAQEDYEGKPLIGLRGKVVDLGLVRVKDYGVGVEFDKYIDGHNCRGKAKQGYGAYIPTSFVKKASDSKPSDASSKNKKSLDDRLKIGDFVVGVKNTEYFKGKGVDGIVFEVMDFSKESSRTYGVKWEEDVWNNKPGHKISYLTNDYFKKVEGDKFAKNKLKQEDEETDELLKNYKPGGKK
ncbi:hypothetical protein AYK26_01410 [Euryarchaeota archaeon SM23-78]|nr:MAG: hypothetical protein AYK26_01410 [Euryarchaeota archaeon SM23-78]MBW3001253.1 hypothetical protein [Candidatus Woesearchaeota archaeon]